jgi:hypothetical protein
MNESMASVKATVEKAIDMKRKRRLDETVEEEARTLRKKAKLTTFDELRNKIRTERLWEDHFELRLKRALGEGRKIKTAPAFYQSTSSDVTFSSLLRC